MTCAMMALGYSDRPMASGDEQWLTVEHAGVSWTIDADFLSSSWTCIWDRGCQGIEAAAAADAGFGCCSVGAELLDEDEAMAVAALAATIDPGDFQHHDELVQHGAFADQSTPAGKPNTRVVDGACIFLNRPGFAGGHGCVLHAEAQRQNESPTDWKPSICWQLPVKVETVGDTKTLRGWQRFDWGPDGQDMAWCCTAREEGGEAFVGDRPVIESLREELVALLGESLVDGIAQRLDTND